MKTIEVIPNPYIAVDADGVPQGVVGLPGVRGAWIGAALDQVASKQTGKSRFYFPAGNEKKSEKTIGGMRVVTLAVTDANIRSTIANAILEGSLIAVSAPEAAKVGLVKEFLDAEKALAAEKDRATANFRAHKGDESLELKPIPHTATASTDDEESGAPTDGARLTKTVTRHNTTEA